MTHICVSKLTNIGSDNGLSPGRRQAIIWTSAGMLLIGPLETNFSEILIEIHFHSRKCICQCRLENVGHFVFASMCEKFICLNQNSWQYTQTNSWNADIWILIVRQWFKVNFSLIITEKFSLLIYQVLETKVCDTTSLGLWFMGSELFQSVYIWVNNFQITKILDQHRSDTFVSDRCLIDVNPSIFAIWDVSDVLTMPVARI